MLNSTKLAQYLGSKLGISHAHLEVAMTYLLDEVRNVTVPTFSHYYPLEMNIPVEFSSTRPGEIIIPSNQLDLGRILHVKKVLPQTYTGTAYVPIENSNVIATQLKRNITSASATRHSFEFFAPNKIIMYPRTSFANANALVTLNIIHDVNFYTIPISLQEEFKKLALIDAKDLIYNIRKNYENISTAFGSLELNLNDFEGMADNRKEITDYWKENYYKSAKRKRIFTTRLL